MTGFEPFPRAALDESIPRRFEAQVARDPRAPAVVSARDRWTYGELNERANALARRLARDPGAEDEPVVLLVEQSAPLVAAILGVLKAGGIYAPLEPAQPLDLLRRLVADSGARLVLASRAALAIAATAAPGTRVLVVEEVMASGDRADLRRPIPPEAGACIYYTSGSTGVPKGVLDTHAGVLHNVMRYTNSLRISRHDRLTLLQGPSFSGAVSSLFAALLNGACSLPFDVPREGMDRIAPWLAREGVTVYHSVPALFRRVAVSRESLPALRLVRLEGDAATRRDVELFRGRFSPACRLVNGLGATECGLVRQFFVGPESPVPGDAVPVGYPVEDMEVVLLDQAGRELGPGAVGEIVVRSRYLARGYWRRPDLTASRFSVVDQATGLRAYRTGDLGRFHPDGCLEHLGRADSSVRIRGQGVVLADVDAVLRALPDVRDACVTTEPDAAGDPRLVAYVVRESPGATVSRLRRALAARLAVAAVPGRFVFLDALPLTAHGKVDRRALPRPTGGRPPLDADPLPPRSLLELQLVDIWQRVLGLAPIGVRDDFFDLGGDSLLAVAMLAEVEEILGRPSPAALLLEGATVEQLAAALQVGTPELQRALMTLRQGGARPPLFFLHGDYLSGGLYCARLARLLGAEQPVHALPPCGVDGEPVPESYEAMARHHLGALRAVAPRGPYRLGGLCNGALVALEMARLLVAGGERVDRLVMVAAVASTFELEWLRCLLDRLGAWRGLPSEARLDRYVRVRDGVQWLRSLPSAGRARRVLARVWQDARGAPRPPRLPSSVLGRVYRRLDVQYVPTRYEGEVTLLWPAEEPVSAGRAARWWRRVCPRLQVHVVPGSHVTCLTTHVEGTAAVLDRCLGP